MLDDITSSIIFTMVFPVSCFSLVLSMKLFASLKRVECQWQTCQFWHSVVNTKTSCMCWDVSTSPTRGYLATILPSWMCLAVLLESCMPIASRGHLVTGSASSAPSRLLPTGLQLPPHVKSTTNARSFTFWELPCFCNFFAPFVNFICTKTNETDWKSLVFANCTVIHEI